MTCRISIHSRDVRVAEGIAWRQEGSLGHRISGDLAESVGTTSLRIKPGFSVGYIRRTR